MAKKKKQERINGFVSISHETANLIRSMALSEDRNIKAVAERLIRKGLELEGVVVKK